MDWENHLQNNPVQKSEKNSKNQRKIAACEQKTTSEKANQTPFSRSTLNLEQKNLRRITTRFFRSTSCFGVTKITTPI